MARTTLLIASAFSSRFQVWHSHACKAQLRERLTKALGHQVRVSLLPGRRTLRCLSAWAIFALVSLYARLDYVDIWTPHVRRGLTYRYFP